MDRLGKIRQHHWKKRALTLVNLPNCKVKGRAPQSWENLQMLAWWGASLCPPPPCLHKRLQNFATLRTILILRRSFLWCPRIFPNLSMSKVVKICEKVFCKHNMTFISKCSNSAWTVSTRGESITESCDEYIKEMSFYIAKSSQLFKTNWETGFRTTRCSVSPIWYKFTATKQLEDDCYTYLPGPFEEELL